MFYEILLKKKLYLQPKESSPTFCLTILIINSHNY